jgi:hypothetical protein
MTLKTPHLDHFSGSIRASIPCGFAVAAIAISDLLTANLNLSILYVVAVLLGIRLPNRLFLWGLAILLLVLTFAGYYLGPSGMWYSKTCRQGSRLFS